LISNLQPPLRGLIRFHKVFASQGLHSPCGSGFTREEAGTGNTAPRFSPETPGSPGNTAARAPAHKARE